MASGTINSAHPWLIYIVMASIVAQFSRGHKVYESAQLDKEVYQTAF